MDWQRLPVALRESEPTQESALRRPFRRHSTLLYTGRGLSANKTAETLLAMAESAILR